MVAPGLSPLAQTLVEPWPRRVRGVRDRQVVVDSSRTVLLIPPDGLPEYYFPAEDVVPQCLEPGTKADRPTRRGLTRFWSVRCRERVHADVARSLVEPAAGVEPLRDLIAFRWEAMDSWYEEDDEVFVHPRSPYHRVDVLHSSRHVRVETGGQVLADSRRPRLLFETGLPIRYYLPVADVHMELLRPSPTVSQCPYKGVASYWSSTAVEDAAWTYQFPIPECPKIEGLIAFFNERCDIWLDGGLLPRPRTPWSDTPKERKE